MQLFQSRLKLNILDLQVLFGLTQIRRGCQAPFQTGKGQRAMLAGNDCGRFTV
jgi:hypothetical protein